MRVYVFVCDKPQYLLEIKKRVRNLFKIGNYCIHINDCREEALALAQFFFNDNTIQVMNLKPFSFEDKKYDYFVNKFKNKILEKKLIIDNFCIGGSSPLNILGIRDANDIDYLYAGDIDLKFETDFISSHDSELKYYPTTKDEIIYNSFYYFWYEGIKIISLKTLYQLKKIEIKSLKILLIVKFKKNITKPRKKIIFVLY